MISKSNFEELLLIKPPKESQQEFADVVKRVERLRSIRREALRQAEHLFQSSLHQVFADTGIENAKQTAIGA